MAKGIAPSLRLVSVDEVPRGARKGVYADLIQEFVSSDMKNAKIEGAKPTAYGSVKKAISSQGFADVGVVTANNELYLIRK